MDKHYVGSFEIDDCQFEGEIIHNAQTGIIRLVVTFELSFSVGFRIKRSKNPKVIIGRLNNGNVVNLYNNELIENITQNFQYQKLVFSVKYMIWSYRKLPLPQFNILICEIENGLLWSGLTAIDTEELTSIHIKDITPKTFIWYNAKITFSTVLHSNLIGSLRKETCEIVEHLLITIETEEKKDVAFFTDIRDKILAMISFAIKDNINILKQYFLCNDDFTFENEQKNYVEHFMFDDNPKYKIQENHPAEYNFRLNNLPEDDAEIPQRLEKLAPIFNLYLSLFKYPHMPFEMVFLNIVQALETLHSRFFYNNDKKK